MDVGLKVVRHNMAGAPRIEVKAVMESAEDVADLINMLIANSNALFEEEIVVNDGDEEDEDEGIVDQPLRSVA